jgi:hypothetical protein
VKRFPVKVESYVKDNRGNTTKTGEWTVPDCYAYPNGSDEAGQFSDTPVTGATLVGPVGARLPNTARVTIPAPHPQAGTWQIEGEFGGIESPYTGWRPGGTVKLRRL